MSNGALARSYAAKLCHLVTEDGRGRGLVEGEWWLLASK